MPLGLRSVNSTERINVSQDYKTDDENNDLPEANPARDVALESSTRKTSNGATSNTSKTSIMPEIKKTTGKLKKPGAAARLQAMREKAEAKVTASAPAQLTKIPTKPPAPERATAPGQAPPRAPSPAADDDDKPVPQPKVKAAAATKAKSPPKPAANAAKAIKQEPKEKAAPKPKRSSRIVVDESDDDDPQPPTRKARAKTVVDDSDEYDPQPSKKTRAKIGTQKKVPVRAAKQNAENVTKPTKQASKSREASQEIEISDDAESSTYEEHIERTAKPPQTPALARTSLAPPDTRKSTVIAFDKSGPRNQGTRPTGGSEAPSTKRVPDLTRRKGPSSAATSMRTTASDRLAPSSNVADSVGDALRGLRSESKAQIPLQSAHTAPTLFKPPIAETRDPVNSASHYVEEVPARQQQQDDEFHNIDDESEPERPAQPAPKKGKKSKAPALNEETAPVFNEADCQDEQQDDIFTIMTDDAEPVPKKTNRSKGSAGMVESAAVVAKVPAVVEQRAKSSMAVEDDERHEQAAHPATALVSERTRRASGKPGKAKSKAVLPEADKEPNKSQTAGSRGAASHDSALSRPSRERAAVAFVSTHEPSRKRKASTGSAEAETNEQPAKKSTRRRSQQLSQNSQSVDRNGSPVPPDFDVDTEKTVLETYSLSQKTSLSSDHSPAVPQRQPDFTSNKKTQPASPQAKSKVIPRVTLTGNSSPPADLVNSTLDNQVNALRSCAAAARSQEVQKEDEDDGDDQEDQELEADDDGEWGEDPDKTLVETEKTTVPTHHLKEKPKALDGDMEPTFSEPLSDDLMDWRTTLKPHQLNLFNELVKVVRHIVGFAAEQENSHLRMLETQHKQGLIRIEQEEMDRAKKHAELTTKLKQARRERKRRLRAAEDNIKRAITKHEADMQDRESEFEELEKKNRQVERLLAKYE